MRFCCSFPAVLALLAGMVGGEWVDGTGRVLEELGKRGRVRFHEVREFLLRRLEDPAGAAALDADFKAKFAALGVRL